MAFAQGARSRLVFAQENTFGTAPTDLTILPINSHTLNLSKALLESQEIRSDRQVAVVRHGNKSVEGSVDVEFRADDYDDLLEGALFGTFNSSGVLELGTTLKTYTFEDGALDIAQYRLFTGCGINTFGLSIRPNEIVTASFGLVGKTATISGTPQDASPTAASTNEPFDSFTGSISVDGSPVAIVTGIDLSVENNIEQAFVIGSDSAAQLEYGRGRVTGQLSLYYEDADFLNYFINETEVDLSFVLDDGVSGNEYTFSLPRIKINGGDVPLDNEQSRIITAPFTGLYSSVDTYSLRITKA